MLAPFIAFIRKRVFLWILAFVGAVLGDLPDLIAVYGYIFRHDHWDLHASAHHGSIGDALKYVPMYGLHLFLDSYTRGYAWAIWNQRMWLEILLWGINIVIISWFVKIWRRNVNTRSHLSSSTQP